MGKINNSQQKISIQVLKFIKIYSDKWWNTKADFPILKNKTDYWHKKSQERETDKFIDRFFKAIELFPKEQVKRKAWRQNVQAMLDNFIAKSDLICEEDRKILLKEDLIQTTKKFTDKVKEFNPNIAGEDIGQAMRNVWIMNIIQLLCSKKPELTPSIFGYSMLYPYTDNYLDDTKISTEDKIKISDRFEKKLRGEIVKPSNNYEESLFKLVGKIEEQYERSSYPEVYESLLCIHDAQRRSLLQQGDISSPYEKDILGISIEKGGISVLADAYLVNGTLTEEEAAFFFGYGVLLQICDDLQDGKKDLEDKHMTIISQLQNKWYLDQVTNKLINFTYSLVEDMGIFNCENISGLKALIRKNCILLILFAIAGNKKMYSKKYFKQIEKYFPYTTYYMTHIQNKLKKKYSNIKESYNGVQTDEIILYVFSK